MTFCADGARQLPFWHWKRVCAKVRSGAQGLELAHIKLPEESRCPALPCLLRLVSADFHAHCSPRTWADLEAQSHAKEKSNSGVRTTETGEKKKRKQEEMRKEEKKGERGTWEDLMLDSTTFHATMVYAMLYSVYL